MARSLSFACRACCPCFHSSQPSDFCSSAVCGEALSSSEQATQGKQAGMARPSRCEEAGWQLAGMHSLYRPAEEGELNESAEGSGEQEAKGEEGSRLFSSYDL